VEAGLRDIKAFFASFDQPQAYYKSVEVRVLRKLRRRIKKKLPPDPGAELKKQLRKAIQEERYEEAARLRDRLRSLGFSPEDV
ncbi:MAG: UvrB/UvrC motif-containing protein, partial [Phycisphaerae bacterium]|nr:UvrB/UvrC motif-containing protein [Phycisphaerae bacterium]